jgi:hypothetical protein
VGVELIQYTENRKSTFLTSNKIAAGLSDYQVVNVFDRAFGANNAKDEFRIKRSSRYDLQTAEMADKEPLDWSQFINYDIGRSSQAPSCLFDPSSSSIASPVNSFYATTPSLLSSNAANDLQSSPQIATPGSYMSTGMSAESSRDLPETCQQHIQDDLSEVPRQLCLETREPEIFPSYQLRLPKCSLTGFELELG